MRLPFPLDPIDAVRTYIKSPAAQFGSLERVDHRPWPLPRQGWLMGQSWLDLLFCHWRVDAEALRALLPREVELDTWEGDAWIGVTPFVIDGLRLRATLPTPGLSNFPEINVRTYVRVQGKPGIWFFSLDTSNSLAVRAARRVFHLPYYAAEIEARVTDTGAVRYAATRRNAPEARFEAVYEPHGPVDEPAPGTLEHFLTERYCLYSIDGTRLLRGEIHHAPWQLQPAIATIARNTMLPAGVDAGRDGPLLQFARRQDALIWSPQATGIEIS